MIPKLKALLQIFIDVICNIFTQKELILISEGFDWVIHEECLTIKKYLETHHLASVRIATTPIGLRNKVVHFLSENTLIGPHGLRCKKGSNRFILTWFHISDADKNRVKYISSLNQELDYLHTASEITSEKLIQYGANPEKIIRIALDVNLNTFHSINSDEKILLRKNLGLPEKKILIGSFQKDGNGWGDGLEPKLIKGPDIFCDVVEKLAKDYPIHIVLTGPARGYVKNRLDKYNIPYTHTYLKHYEHVAQYFQAIDMYLITSREEGGPKAIVEGMATGTPVISTRVGMVPDIITNGVNGFIVDTGDTKMIELKARQLIESAALRKSITTAALKEVTQYSSEKMVQNFYDKMYKHLLKN